MANVLMMRVSTQPQCLERQEVLKEKYKIDKVFAEKISGKSVKDRTAIRDMLNYIRNGLCCPMSMLYDNYCAKDSGGLTYASTMYESLNNGTNTFSSTWAEQYNAKISKWSAIKSSFGGHAN